MAQEELVVELEELLEVKEAMQVRPLQRHPWMALQVVWVDPGVTREGLVAEHPSVEP